MKYHKILLALLFTWVIQSKVSAQLYTQSFDVSIALLGGAKVSYTKDLSKHISSVIHLYAYSDATDGDFVPEVGFRTTVEERRNPIRAQFYHYQMVGNLSIGTDLRAQTRTFWGGARLFTGITTSLAYFDVEKYELTDYQGTNLHGTLLRDYDVKDVSATFFDLEVGFVGGIQVIVIDRIALELFFIKSYNLFSPYSSSEEARGVNQKFDIVTEIVPNIEFKVGYRF